MIKFMLIAVLLFVIYAMIFDKKFSGKNDQQSDHNSLIQDLAEVCDRWNIEYDIERDTDGNEMMVIVRKDSDPFFWVTREQEKDKFTK